MGRNAIHAAAEIISIHALHEESDLTPFVQRTVLFLFQSTLSMRRATVYCGHCC